MLFFLLDFETTGLDPASDELIEVGAIRVRVEPSGKFTEESRFSTLVRPDSKIPHEIQRLTGITDEAVRDAPGIEDTLPRLQEFLSSGDPDSDPVCIAHNASMEQGFLDALYERHRSAGLGTPPRVINSIEPLALLLAEHGSHSMESMRKWAGLSLEGSHRALEDCEALLAVLNHAQDFMRRERPWVPGLVLGFLKDESQWDWRWFFENPLGYHGLVDERPPAKAERGDLRELKKADEKRSDAPLPESRLSKSNIETALQAGARLQGLELRPQQLALATSVLEAQKSGARVAIEAPTGTGKSLGYLLPGLLRARETGTPLVVSTHSKALQDQLIEKDIPKLEAVLEAPIRATAVKGQNNYLCLRKLDEWLSSVGFSHTLEEKWASAYLSVLEKVEPVVVLEKISRYLRNLFPALDEVIDRVRSQHTTTLGPPCPFYKQCHFFDSARIAHESEVIIANHALAFSWPAHLPQIRDLVIDEGHHLEEQLTQSLTQELTEWDLDEACDRLARRQGGAGTARGGKKLGDAQAISRLVDGLSFEDFLSRTQEIRTRSSHLRTAAPLWMPHGDGGGGSGGGYDGYEQSLVLKGPQAKPIAMLSELRAAVRDLHGFLVQLTQKLAGAKSSLELDLLKTHEMRFGEFASVLEAGLSDDANFLKTFYWDGRETTWRIQIEPIEVAGLGEPFFATKRSVVVTSATLSAGTQSEFVTSRVGLKLGSPLLQLPSPYDLAKAATVYFPTAISPPGTPGHLDALASFAETITMELGGRTLLLMSSNRRLRIAAERLRQRLGRARIEVFDSVSDRRAVDGFLASERAILVGGERYGEGLDIPGPKLTCVILEKINEAMTRSPLAEARKSRTKFALFDYDFPLRMIWLKQRVGRLIRSPSDTGAVVVFDPRYSGWSQGSRTQVDRTLAPMPIRILAPDEIALQIARKFGSAIS